MSNTVIQIKRSSTNTAPSTLQTAEQAYSFLSNKLFIGNANGNGVIEVGGKYYTDRTDLSYTQANSAYGHANAGYGHANAGYTHANSAYGTANAGFLQANAAYGHANAGYTHANSAYTHANNAYTTANNALPKAGGTVSGDLVVSGNLTISGQTTYANTQTLNIGDNIFSLNADLPNNTAPTQSAGMEVIRGNANTVSLLWNEADDRWTIVDANLVSRYIASNTDVESAISSASTASSNASNLTTGTVPSGRLTGSYTGITGVGTLTVGTWNATTITVPYGGTGRTSVTTNGILFGNGANALQVTSAGTDGQVLQANASGVPEFGMLDGGTF